MSFSLKNIDNIVPDRLKAETILFKKIIAGLLLKTQDRIFSYLKALESDSLEDLSEVIDFIKGSLGYQPQGEPTKEEVFTILNRPIRVCGMVKNEGEPGGGPFWVTGEDGSVSLQVVETAQIDLSDADQNALLKQSTHFNPVDVVCGTKNFKGEKFDLANFRDPNTGFIAEKSKDGKKLKAQELPGLWNGSMANWNTLFVEVPLITFNPVKSVSDLLKDQHQGELSVIAE